MLEKNRRGVSCVRIASEARGIIPARRWCPYWVLTALCLLALTMPALAQKEGELLARPQQDGMSGVVGMDGLVKRIKDQWLLFSFLGSLLVVSTAAFVVLSRKKEPVPSQIGLAEAAAPSAESPWARSTPSAISPVPPLSYASGNAPAAWSPPVVPMASPDATPHPVQAAQYAPHPGPQTSMHHASVTPNPHLPQSDPVIPALRQTVAEMPAANMPVVPLGYPPLPAASMRTQVDFPASHQARVEPPSAERPPYVPAVRTDIEQTIYVAADSDGTINEANPTLTILPGYFEVIASGDAAKDPIGTRKKLYALNSNPDFGIARPTNDQEQIANFIPLHSKRVSRSVDKQGKIVYDFEKGTYTIINFADPTHVDPARRCNPIRLEGRPLMPNEGALIRDGDRIQVGDIMLRFHIEGRVATVGLPPTNTKNSQSRSPNSG